MLKNIGAFGVGYGDVILELKKQNFHYLPLSFRVKIKLFFFNAEGGVWCA